MQENRQAFEVFMAGATQWRVAPMGGLIGLDYAVLPFLMRLEGVQGRANQADCMQRLRMIEAAALKQMHAKSPR